MSDDPMTPHRPGRITPEHTACDHRISMGWHYALHTSIVYSKAKGFKDPGPLCTCNRFSRHRIPNDNMRRVQAPCAMTIVTKAHDQRECRGEVSTPHKGHGHLHQHGLQRALVSFAVRRTRASGTRRFAYTNPQCGRVLSHRGTR